MTLEEIQKKIGKEPWFEGQRILPFPWQDDGEWYPEYDEYKDIFEATQKNLGMATNYIIAYNAFYEYIKSIEYKMRVNLLKKINKLPTHQIHSRGGVPEDLIHLADIYELLKQPLDMS